MRCRSTGSINAIDVFGGDVVAVSRKRARLGRQHDELGGANAGSIVHVLLHEIGRLGIFRAGGADQAHNVFCQRLCDRHHAHQLAENRESPRRW